MHLLQTSSYLERLLFWQIAIWSSGYLVATQRHRSPGVTRLTLAVPLAALNFILPLLFDGKDDAMTAVIVFMTTTGLSNFKLLAWAMNRGPLTESWLTKMQFAAVYVFTVTPTRSTATNNPLLDPVPAEKRARLLLVKILGMCISVPAYAMFIDELPHVLSTVLQGKKKNPRQLLLTLN
jgi:hypothetical protein